MLGNERQDGTYTLPFKKAKPSADSLAVIDDILDHAREMAKRGHRVAPFETGNALKAYCHQKAEVVVFVRTLAGEECEIIFRACGPMVGLDNFLPPVWVNYFYAENIRKNGNDFPVFVGSAEQGEDVEAVIPSFVRVERPKIRVNFWGKARHWMSGEPRVKFGGGPGKGEGDALDRLGIAQPPAFGSDVIEGIFEVVRCVAGNHFGVGVRNPESAKLMNILGFFEVWFCDGCPSIVGTKPIDGDFEVIDMAFCVVEE